MKWQAFNFGILLLLLSFSVVQLGCSSDDPIPINSIDDNDPTPPDEPDDGDSDMEEEPEEESKVDYMLFTRSPSSANGFITGFDEFPEGAINVPDLPETLAFPAISGGIAYNDYVVNQQKLFGGAGYQRVILNENKVPTDAEIIETLGGGSAIAVLNDEKGYYVDFNERNIQIFNPTTFVRTGAIDLTEAFEIPENASNYYVSLYLRGNRLFACLYTGAVFPPFLYQSDVGSIVAIIDTDTDTYLNDIFFEGTKYPGQPFLRFSGMSMDEIGNLYIATQGGLTLDKDSENTPGVILKIPAGSSDFDPNYTFTPQNLISESTATTAVNAGFLYAGNGIGYTNVLMTDPATGADLVNEPLMRWVKIDLIGQTAELVKGIPANVGLTAGMAYNYQGKVQLVVYNPTEGLSAVYETETTSDTATLKFEVAAGGIIYGLYEIEENDNEQ